MSRNPASRRHSCSIFGSIAACCYRRRSTAKRGRKLKPADDSVDPDAVANVTDPDSEIMKTRRGLVQGYNGQAVVTADQIIVAAELTTQANDVQQLQPMLNQQQRIRRGKRRRRRHAGHGAGRRRLLVGRQCRHRDGGVHVADCHPKRPPASAALREAPPPRGRMPKNLTTRQRMDRKLRDQTRPRPLSVARPDGRTSVRTSEGAPGR